MAIDLSEAKLMGRDFTHYDAEDVGDMVLSLVEEVKRLRKEVSSLLAEKLRREDPYRGEGT